MREHNLITLSANGFNIRIDFSCNAFYKAKLIDLQNQTINRTNVHTEPPEDLDKLKQIVQKPHTVITKITNGNALRSKQCSKL